MLISPEGPPGELAGSSSRPRDIAAAWRGRVVDQLFEVLLGRETVRGFPLPERPLPPQLYYAVGRAYAQLTTAGPGDVPARDGIQGIVYSPRQVALRLVDLVESESGRRTVCDPACGAGSLLLAWLERHPEDVLVGRDVDAAAVRLARGLIEDYGADRGLAVELDLGLTDLFAEAGGSGGGRGNHPAVDRDRQPASDRARRVAALDSLGADVVLMNPPYGTVLSERAKRWAARSPLVGREADLFALAVERVARRHRGPLALILPDVVRMQPEYARLRRFLHESGRLRQIAVLPFGAFPEATVRPCLVYLGGAPVATGAPAEGPAEELATVEAVEVLGETARGGFLDVESVRADPLSRWNLVDPRLARIWRRCNRGAQALGQVAHCHEGIHTGNIRAKLFTDDPDAPSARPLLKGADVTPFGARFRDRYVRYDPSFIDRQAGEYASLRDPRIFEPPKLFSRQTTSRLIVCVDRTRRVADNSLHSIRTRADAAVSLTWLALYLNSSLATALYRHQSGEWHRPLPQIKLKLLRRLPVHQPDEPEKAAALLDRAEAEVAMGELDSATIDLLDAIVFDTFGVDESDRGWLRHMVR